MPWLLELVLIATTFVPTSHVSVSDGESEPVMVKVTVPVGAPRELDACGLDVEKMAALMTSLPPLGTGFLLNPSDMFVVTIGMSMWPTVVLENSLAFPS